MDNLLRHNEESRLICSRKQGIFQRFCGQNDSDARILGRPLAAVKAQLAVRQQR